MNASVNEPASAGAVIAAGGSGRRFGHRKQYVELLGRPSLHWSLVSLAAVERVRQIVVVVPASDVELARGILAAPPARGAWPNVALVPGGARRQDSVLAGLEALDSSLVVALVHDAARPLVRSADVVRLLDAVERYGAAALGHPAHDSLKREKDGQIAGEVAREHIWAVQTPQGARRELLLRAYRQATAAECTDEATALRMAGVDVRLVEGPRDNLKITRPGDERLAEAILRARGEG